MFRRPLLAFSLLWSSRIFAADAPAPSPAPKKEKEKEKSEWVFSILPKSMQKNPLLDITVITEMTEAGKKLPPVSTAQPAFFELVSGGFKQLGDAPANEKTLKQEDIEKLLVRALGANGYQRTQTGHAPSLLIVYTWGSHNRKEEVDPDNPSMSGATVAANILDRAALVGGEKFAARLLQLFEEADTQSMAANTHLAPGAQPVMTPEMIEFTNPVAMFRRASAKNESLLDQTANDVYYVVASAYDYQLAAQRKRLLLWRTRMTVAAQGVSQEQTLPTLVISAGPYFGKDMPEAELITKRMREGVVEVGTPVVVPPNDEKPDAKKSGK